MRSQSSKGMSSFPSRNEVESATGMKCRACRMTQATLISSWSPATPGASVICQLSSPCSLPPFLSLLLHLPTEASPPFSQTHPSHPQTHITNLITINIADMSSLWAHSRLWKPVICQQCQSADPKHQRYAMIPGRAQCARCIHLGLRCEFEGPDDDRATRIQSEKPVTKHGSRIDPDKFFDAMPPLNARPKDNNLASTGEKDPQSAGDSYFLPSPSNPVFRTQKSLSVTGNTGIG